MAVSNIGYSNIMEADRSYLQFNSYNEISNNTVFVAINAVSVHVQEHTIIILTSNTFKLGFDTTTSTIILGEMIFFEVCPIQYVSNKGNLDKQFQRGDKLNYSIIFSNNNTYVISIRY